MTPLRLAFMGSPGIAATVLASLIDAGHDIVCVYSQPPRKAGRGKKMRLTDVHAFAEAAGIEVRTPKTLRKPEAQAAFAALNLDAAIVVAYGLILPQPILDAPQLGCLNMHASILPRWRGAAPIQRAIMAGDTETGVDAMMMEAGLDTGPVLATARTPITAEDTAGTLHDRIADLAAELAPRALMGLADGRLSPMPQSEDGATYAHKIEADDQAIQWTAPAGVIDAQIRGLAPRPAAACLWTPPGETEAVRLKLLMSQRVDQGTADAPAGMVLDEKLMVACGDGRAVRITRLQKPGGKPMDADTFLMGTPIAAGERLFSLPLSDPDHDPDTDGGAAG